MLTIRPARTADLDALASLAARLPSPTLPSGAWELERLLERSDDAFAAEIDFAGEDKYLSATRDGSAFHQHRARIELLPQFWLVGEADYDMTQSRMETSAAGSSRASQRKSLNSTGAPSLNPVRCV